jgi:[CysO sulfur-carrier protein]-S-L-cysteine hydrolase
MIVRLRCFFLVEAAAYIFLRHAAPGEVALTT